MTTLLPTVRRVDRGRFKDRHYVVSGVPELEGVELPSVTTVLSVINKPAIGPWMVKTALECVRQTLVSHLGERPLTIFTEYGVDELITESRKRPDAIKDEAADLGTRAHIYIEHLLQGGALPECDEDIKPCVDAFWAWYEATGLDIAVSERMVFSHQHRFAGALDGMGRFKDGRKVIVDWKTSSGLWPEYALQASAYWWADGEMTGEFADEVWVVRFPKKVPEKPTEKPFETLRVRSPELTFHHGFLPALWLYNALKQAAWA